MLGLILPTRFSSFSQECTGYYYLKNNTEIVMTNYDKKDQESGKVTFKITDLKNEGGVVSAHFSSEAVNDKGKRISGGEGIYKCSGGVMYIDARVSLPSEQMSAYKDMDVKADEVYIEYPASLSAGQSLPDADFKMTVSNKGTPMSEITYRQMQRKVEGKESVTTPAGTWECWKISSTGYFKAGIAGSGIGIPFNFQTTEWFAPGFGVVKTVTLTKNGKMAGYSMISSVK